MLVATNAQAESHKQNQTIMVDQVRGILVKLVRRGKNKCGKLDWWTMRQPGKLTILNRTFDYVDDKMPLSKSQWQTVLTKVVGNNQEITIAHAWGDEIKGLAAAVRAANDIRSHGGKAWAYNGKYDKSLANANIKCKGEYAFTNSPEKIYLTEQEFWQLLRKGQFLDARGKARAAKPTGLTYVLGSPKNSKTVHIGSFIKNGKLDKGVYSCDTFKDVTVIGCDTVHKAMLAREAARYANCDTQPDVMPYWGLSGASRHKSVAEHLWGKDVEPNPNRSSWCYID